MIDWLIELDKQLFLLINRTWSNTLFDAVLPYLREARFWIPLYLFFLVWLIITFRKKSWIPVLGLLLTVGATDRISSGLMKPGFERPRPCHEASLEGKVVVRKLDGNCGGAYGFVSSHASNHFAIALFLVLLLAKRKRRSWWHLLFLWALAISYSQIYVGVHYPGDVFFGALLGMAIAWGSAYVCKRILAI